jgi:hypothetical protein
MVPAEETFAMTTHPALGRISPLAWLLLQVAAIGSAMRQFRRRLLTASSMAV